ncbi:hypothetical protein PR003_g9075 [Phytophthora rubi]|uniref:Uncharacterized protein n=1 Tax=Phytophthora rubi TaxID=129364 RepID=A0A6A3IXP1_9STRA|nr:hypothetical protein PR001_g22495 [Phytophthora rubi]KAE9343270.1 hypothetical protein PR003_g9075 [Phytophthora rubi]
MTTETQIIVRAAPIALGAAGPAKHHADVPTSSDTEEKPPAPASKKHSGDPEEHVKGADDAKKLPASNKPKVAATKKKAKAKTKTPASPKPARKTKKVAASSKPVMKKPAAKQLSKKKGSAKESPKALKLPPKRSDVLLPGPHEEVTETQIIVRAAPIALGAAGPAKHHADVPTSSDTEEKPPAPASKKHSGDPEEHVKGADDAKKLPASNKPKVAATKKKAKAKTKTPASPKPARKTKKVAASSKPVMKKPAAKQLSKKKGSAKESLKLPPKRSDVLLPGPHEEVSSGSSDTDTPNPGYVSGADSPVPRTRASTKDHAASANDATTSPPGRSPSPHPSLDVDYEESEPDMDHEAGEVEWPPKQITDSQRVLHPGSPMSPKTVVAVGRAPLLEASMSRRDDTPAAVSEPQVITNAGVDEGVPSELLQPENRQHLADRTRQEASQAVGTKRDRETHAPRTQEQLLAL